MNDATERSAELHRCRRMLDDLHDIAEHATLTGGYADGRQSAVARYNAILRRVIELGAVQEGMFDALPGDAGFGQVAIEARMLASSIRHDATTGRHGRDRDEPGASLPDLGALIALAPFVGRSELTEMVRKAMRGAGRLDPGMLLGLAPFLDEGEVGRLVREHMSDLFTPTPPEPPEPPSPPEPPTPPEPPEPVHAEADGAARLRDIASRMAAVADRTRELAQSLAASQDPAEQAVLASEIAALAQKRAALAEEVASLTGPAATGGPAGMG